MYSMCTKRRPSRDIPTDQESERPLLPFKLDGKEYTCPYDFTGAIFLASHSDRGR